MINGLRLLLRRKRQLALREHRNTPELGDTAGDITRRTPLFCQQHYSIYGATEHVVAAFEEELALFKVDRGTIRFPLSGPVPVKLIGRIAKFRAKEIAERDKVKKPAPKKR